MVILQQAEKVRPVYKASDGMLMYSLKHSGTVWNISEQSETGYAKSS